MALAVVWCARLCCGADFHNVTWNVRVTWQFCRSGDVRLFRSRYHVNNITRKKKRTRSWSWCSLTDVVSACVTPTTTAAARAQKKGVRRCPEVCTSVHKCPQVCTGARVGVHRGVQRVYSGVQRCVCVLAKLCVCAGGAGGLRVVCDWVGRLQLHYLVESSRFPQIFVDKPSRLFPSPKPCPTFYTARTCQHANTEMRVRHDLTCGSIQKHLSCVRKQENQPHGGS